MATYKDMHTHPANPIESDFVASGKIKDIYILSIGPIRLTLSEEEKENIIQTWTYLDDGIDPETNQPFTQEKLKILKEDNIKNVWGCKIPHT